MMMPVVASARRAARSRTAGSPARPDRLQHLRTAPAFATRNTGDGPFHQGLVEALSFGLFSSLPRLLLAFLGAFEVEEPPVTSA